MTAPISNGPTTHGYTTMRDATPLQRCFREKTRPARHKPPILGHFSYAGRTFSRTGSCDVATLKPMKPLQPLMQTNVKPPSPMLVPEQHSLKPTTPMQPKYAPNTPISHPQRRWWFHLRLGLREQRRWRFHARDFRCKRAMARPDQHAFACNSTTDTSRLSMQSLKFRAFYGAIDDRRPGIACEIAKQ